MNNFSNSQFNLNFKEQRSIKGWSQTECAEQLGFKPAAISHFETGRREPSFENLKKICVGFGVSPNELMRWVDDKRS